MQDKKQPATVAEKLNRSKTDFEFQYNIVVKKDISKLGFNIDIEGNISVPFKSSKVSAKTSHQVFATLNKIKFYYHISTQF